MLLWKATLKRWRVWLRGADPSLMDNEEWNSSHYAAHGGDTDVISLIHTHLPNIESKTGEYCTPLMLATLSGKLHAVQWFQWYHISDPSSLAEHWVKNSRWSNTSSHCCLFWQAAGCKVSPWEGSQSFG